MKAIRKNIWGFSFVVILNFLLNLWVLGFNSKVPFSVDYWGNHHFFVDERINGGSFNLLRAWGQTDSQWYLKIASLGYGEPKNLDITKWKMDGLSYAFFPLYPLFIRTVSVLTNGNFELAAFILSNLIMFALWVSINYVVSKIFSPKLAFLVAVMILSFPFSLFLRSYHAEGLYLLELIWWLFFMSKRKMGWAAVFLGAMNITKGTGWLLNFIYFYYLYKEIRRKKSKYLKFFFYLLTTLSPIIFWLAFVYMKTEDPLYFYKAISKWKVPELLPILFNVNKVVHFVPEILEGHFTNASQVVVFVAMCWLLWASRKWLKPEWWWTSFVLLLVPTLTTYSTGHTSGRLALIQIPLWIFLSNYLGRKGSIFVSGIFTIFLFWGSLYFVNWYWWG